VRVSKTQAGERLPYLLSKLKAPRVLERLEQTAALAREQEWPYERSLRVFLCIGGWLGVVGDAISEVDA
jgi:hypothetical protein